MYNPSLHTSTNKPIAPNGVPTDARSYYFDESLFAYRVYNSTAEVLSYLVTAPSRTGNFPIFIKINNIVYEYSFRDGILDSNLVQTILTPEESLKRTGGTITGNIVLDNGTNISPQIGQNPNNGDVHYIYVSGTNETDSLVHFRWINDLNEPQGWVFEYGSNTSGSPSTEILRVDLNQFKYKNNDVWHKGNLDPSSIGGGTTPVASLGKASSLALSSTSSNIKLDWINNNSGLGDGLKVAVIGSSTSAGNGASSYPNSYVGLLTTFLTSTYQNVTLTNLAVGGYTTYHLMPTGFSNPSDRPAPDTARNITAALALNPNVIIINIPTNDTSNGYANEEYLNNLMTVYSIGKNAGVKMYITTTQPRNLGDAQRAALYTLTQDTFVLIPIEDVLDFYTQAADSNNYIKAELNSGDGIHQNDTGHAIMFNIVKAKLQPYIENTIKATDIQVERYTNSTNTWNGITPTVGKLARTYVDTNIVNGGFYSYRIKTTGVNGTATSDSKSIRFTGAVVNPTPNVTVSPASASISSGQTATFTASADIGSSTFKWYDVSTGGSPLASTASFTTPALTSSKTYYVEATSPAGVVSNRISVPVTIAVSGPKRVLIDMNYTLSDGTVSPITTSPDANGYYWNNINVNAPTTYPAVLASSVVATDNTFINGFSLVTSAAAGSPNTNGTIGNGNGAGATTAVGEYPATATIDTMFYDAAGGIKTLTFNIPTGKTAAIKIWGSRNAAGPRILQMRKQGDTTWTEVECAMNTTFTQAINFTGITGSQVFEVQVKSGSPYGYISVIDITLA